MEEANSNVKKSSLIADSMLFFAVLCWAVSFPIAKIAMTDWGEYKFFFLGGRFWLASIIFVILAFRVSSWEKLIAHLKPGFWVGITLLAAFGFQYKALKIGSSGEVALITALSAVLVPVGIWIAFGKRAKAVIWLGLAIATAGAILIGYSPFSFDSAGWMAFISAIGIAIYIILYGHFLGQKDEAGNPKYEKVPFLTMKFLVLAVTATVMSLFTEISGSGLPPWSGRAVFAMIFMTIVATAGAFFIQAKYQPKTSPERVALVFTLESPLAALFGYLLLGEAYTVTMVIGAGLIVAGVAIAELFSVRESGPPPKPEELPDVPPAKPQKLKKGPGPLAEKVEVCG